MWKKAVLLLLPAIIFAASCKSDKKETKKDVPPFAIKGDIMEIYYPDGTLQGKGGVKVVKEGDKTKNIKSGDWTLYHKDSKGAVVAAKGKFADDKRDGLWIINYPSGKLKSETNYSAGSMNGLQKNYSEDGKLMTEIPYVNDKISGKKTTYDKTGAREKEEQYLNNKKNGVSLLYYQNGKLRIQSNYTEDKLIGAWSEFYPTGTKKMEGQYKPVTQKQIEDDPRMADKEGIKTGTWILYHKDGKKFMTGSYVENKMTGKWLVYAPEGYLESEGMYEENSRNGIWKFYNAAGVLEKEYFFVKDMVNGKCRIYKDGRLFGEGNMTGLAKGPKIQGEWRQFYPNGRPEFEGTYMLNKKSGKFTEYHQNGNLKAQGEFMNDKRNGPWIYYLQDGKTRDDANSGTYMMDRLNKKLGN